MPTIYRRWHGREAGYWLLRNEGACQAHAVRYYAKTSDRRGACYGQPSFVRAVALMVERRLKLLLVEDDLDVAAGIGAYLQVRGIDVDFAYSAAQSRTRLAAEIFDLVVLDINLPDQDGIALCRQLKDAAGLRSPVLFLTARASLADKLLAFQAGALDYMVKPFAPAELLARILAISAHATAVGGAVLQVGDYILDLHGRLLRRGTYCMSLHASGFVLMRSLMQASPGAVAHEVLQAQLWEGQSPGSHALRMHVYLLRQQLQACFGVPLIETRRGMGYRFIGSDHALV